jgi:hypothetical protein
MARTKISGQQFDPSDLPFLWTTDPTADELLARKAIDGSVNRLRLDYVPPVLPYAAWQWLFDDFMNNSAFAGGLVSTTSGTGASHSTVAGEPSAPGIISGSTGTTTTGRAALATSVNALRLGQGRCLFEARVRIPNLSNATDSFTVRIGYLDSVSGEATDGAFFRYTHSVNSGNWQAVCRDNNNETTANFSVGPVTSDWQKLAINVYPDGSRVDFTIAGTGTEAIATNIPTTSGRQTGLGYSIIKSAGTTARTILLDYLWHTFNLATAR